MRVLDIGCGPAIASLVLALDDRTATVTGLDRRLVVEVARRVAVAMRVTSLGRSTWSHSESPAA